MYLPRSTISQERIIIVGNQLPIRTHRSSDDEGHWNFSWDEESLLLQLKDGIPEDVEIIYVGNLREEVDPSEQDDVSRTLLETFNCVPAFIPPDLFSKCYYGFCKQHLWPLFHYKLLSPGLGGRFDQSLWQAYISTNKIFADKVMEVISSDYDFVWVHDYQLMVLPIFLRKRLNRVNLGFFLHIPFPPSEIFRALPVGDELLRALLYCDLIGFHTFTYARHFLSCCRLILGISYQSKRGYILLKYYGRTVSIMILPVGIHIGQLQSMLDLPETGSRVAELRDRFRGQNVFLGVDDMDIFKGINLKLLAFEQLLAKQPDQRGKIVLVQIANPALSGGKDVQVFQSETYPTVKRINQNYGQPGYEPVVLIDTPLLFYERIAYYVIAECCVITAVRDGMNLIPYEYIVCRQGTEKLDVTMGLSPLAPKTSMLVISEFIGSSKFLSGATRVNPWNIDAVAEAMRCTPTVGKAEKQLRHEKHYRFVSTHDVAYWAHIFLQDLERSCRDHLRRRCQDFGLGFRVIALDPSFRKLSIEHIVSAYKRTKNRAILLDFDGAVTSWSNISTTLHAEVVRVLNTLCKDIKNVVFIVSAKSRDILAHWFSSCENLGIAAEHGYFVRPSQNEDWETCGTVPDFHLMEIVERVMLLYTETTPGSYVCTRESAIAWLYEDADPDIGICQAKELLNHLERVVRNEPVTLKSGQHIVEVKVQGVNKGIVAERVLAMMQKRGMIPDFVLCMGDDQSDEDMFEMIMSAMDSGSVSPVAEVFPCTVGQTPSKAKYYLEDVPEIIRMLQGLAAAS